MTGFVQMGHYSPNGRFLVQETFPKTLPRFVLILISLQRWQHRACKETKHFVSPHLIGPQLYQLEKRCVDWSISRDLLGADICGELPELSETNAERGTGVPLLSAAESNGSHMEILISNPPQIHRTLPIYCVNAVWQIHKRYRTHLPMNTYIIAILMLYIEVYR